MSDRELLEKAAKAARLEICHERQEERDALGCKDVGLWLITGSTCWNPLKSDGDALRLAVTLRINVCGTLIRANAIAEKGNGGWIPVSEPYGDDPHAATRRAIVRAAAALA